MKIKLLKSDEIDYETWQLVTSGFNKAFDREKSEEEFIDYYHNTMLGYSFHALAYDDGGQLMGSTTVIPQYYIVNGKRELFGLSGGSYVLEEFRKDIFIFFELATEIRKYCESEGLKVIVGVSNKNSFRYTIKFLGSTHLMDLDYYAIPFRFGSITNPVKASSVLNFLSMIFFRTFFLLNSLLSFFVKSKAKSALVGIEFNEEYKKIRFRKGYQTITTKDFFVAYKLVDEKGLKTIYLIEYRENNIRSYNALTFAVNQINVKESFDLILFVGTMKHFQFNFFKIPKKKHPQRLPLVYDILGDIDIPLNILHEKANWDFSLVNFDVR